MAQQTRGKNKTIILIAFFPDFTLKRITWIELSNHDTKDYHFDFLALAISQCRRGSGAINFQGCWILLADVSNERSKEQHTQKTNPCEFMVFDPDSLGIFNRDLSALKPFVTEAHRNHVKVLFSIGGGSKQPQYHHLLKDDKRGILINNLVSEVLKYDLDGVDVDLEGSNIDEYYETFVVELGVALRLKGKLITAATAIYCKEQLTDKALAEFDFVNVMSYDRTGPWRPEKPGPHSTYEHAVEDLGYFGSIRKIPKKR